MASGLAVVGIDEVEGLPETLWSEAERTYARSKSDPSRRLAARLAAKRAVARLLGVALEEVEVLPARGSPPRLGLSEDAEHALRRRGASHTLLSLTHGRTHAAAAVLLLA